MIHAAAVQAFCVSLYFLTNEHIQHTTFLSYNSITFYNFYQSVMNSLRQQVFAVSIALKQFTVMQI